MGNLKKLNLRNAEGKFIRLSQRPTKEKLERLYIGEKRNAPEIGKMFGVSKTAILNWMREFEIPRRKQSESLSPTVKKLWKLPKYRARMMEVLNELWSRSGERSRNTKKLWRNTKWRKKVIASRIKSLVERPTKPEGNIIDLINMEGFPFRYCGDGSFIIGTLNPDFISIDGSQKVIEVFGRVFHDPGASFKDEIPWHQQYWGRMAYYAQLGYKCLILWDDELKDERKIAKKIRGFAS